MMNIWQQAQQDTLVSQNYVYFDTGAAAPPPKPVIDAVKYTSTKQQNKVSICQVFAKQHTSRSKFAGKKLPRLLVLKKMKLHSLKMVQSPFA